MAVVSQYPFEILNGELLQVEEVKKRPLYKVDMDMRLGKGYKPTQTSMINYRFQLFSKQHIMQHTYYLYEIVH